MQPTVGHDPILAQILAMPDSPKTLLLHNDRAEASSKGKFQRFLARRMTNDETAPAINAVEYLRRELGVELVGRSRISVVAAKRVIQEQQESRPQTGMPR